MTVRFADGPDDVAGSVALDAMLLGADNRAAYIRRVAEQGGLSVAVSGDVVQGFVCLDLGYFFEKPFVSLLMVSRDARRRGLGKGLLLHAAGTRAGVWTSTNRSNMPMRQLLDKVGWRYCGEVCGLDEGDPELFYKKC